MQELRTTISEQAVAVEIRKRSWRMQQLQDWADDILTLRAARKTLYADETDGGYEFEVADPLAEAKGGPRRLQAEGCAGADPTVYPQIMVHSGRLIGGASGMMVKDYRGKNAEQEIWKFDAALVDKFLLTLRQAAIEEGQWNEKRVDADSTESAMVRARLKVAQQKLVDMKTYAEANGKQWP